MKYVIYKTTCIINGMQYIGWHATENIHDDYLGSGKYLWRAIEKHGKKNFKKEILFIFDDKVESIKKELELVNEEWVKRKDTYNLKVGGEGGWDYINNELIKDIEHMKKKYEKVSVSIKNLYKENKLVGWKINHIEEIPNGMLGKQHSKQSRKLISEHNAMTLEQSVIDERLNDYNEIEKKRGYITKLGKQWNVSHTQVKRFISKYT